MDAGRAGKADMAYEWLKALHVLSAFGFFIAHGASAAVGLRLPSERDPGRLRALLDLSSSALGPFTWASALVMLVSGIAMGFLAAWWSAVWIWASIVLFIVITFAMTPLGAFRLNAIRTALGMSVNKKAAVPPVPQGALEAVVARYDPRPATWIGGLGLAIIVVLMVVKPF